MKEETMKLKRKLRDETGAATAEYAIATMAAVGFAGLLVVIMRSDEIRTILFDLVKSALTFANPNGDAAAQQ
jgi:Flp pilus assembly pilin Flp